MDVRNLFRLKKETKPIKNKIIRYIRILEHEKVDYYKPVSISSLWSNILLNIKVMAIELKHYQLKNILIKLGHTSETS